MRFLAVPPSVVPSPSSPFARSAALPPYALASPTILVATLLAPFSNPVGEPGGKSPPRRGHHRRVAVSLEPSFVDSPLP